MKMIDGLVLAIHIIGNSIGTPVYKIKKESELTRDLNNHYVKDNHFSLYF